MKKPKPNPKATKAAEAASLTPASKKIGNYVYAISGSELTAKAAARLRRDGHAFTELLSTKEGCTVQPKSEVQYGRWMCIDCGEVFQNNMMCHLHARSHRRAWWTGERIEEA